jgi:peptidyl-tRNA hydrolase
VSGPPDDDPLVMYLVVRKDAPLAFGRAMTLAGAGASRCVARFASEPGWAPAFARWAERPRKVALRAASFQLAELAGALAAVSVTDAGEPVLLCLPPCRRSQRPALAALRPYTDGPRVRRGSPSPPAPAARPLLTYVIRPGVLRTAGKAMAQAGHAALAAERALGRSRSGAFAAWHAAGEPGDVRAADPEAWRALRDHPDAVVVRDAGLTQVAPDTETVLAFGPGDHDSALEDLPVVP